MGKIIVQGFEPSQNQLVYTRVRYLTKGYSGDIHIKLRDNIINFLNTNKMGFRGASYTVAGMIVGGGDLLKQWCEQTLEGSLVYAWENTSDQFVGPTC